MQPVQTRQHVEERAMRVRREVEPTRDELTPSEKLRGQKAEAEQKRHKEPEPVGRLFCVPERRLRARERQTADDDERGAQVDERGHLAATPVGRRRHPRTDDVGAGERREHHQYRG